MTPSWFLHEVCQVCAVIAAAPMRRRTASCPAGLVAQASGRPGRGEAAECLDGSLCSFILVLPGSATGGSGTEAQDRTAAGGNMRKWLVLAALALPLVSLAAQRVMVNEEFTATS
jgi:hypothetical protein